MEDRLAGRNALLVNVATFCSELSFVIPIWLLYSTSQLHLSAGLASLLFTGMWAIGSLFEIPTGAISDRMGRRRSYLIGACLMLVFPLAFIINPPLPMFVALVIVAGFGSSLVSGSLIPLVHASYEAAKLPKRSYHAFLSTNRAILFCARIAGGIVGAWMYAVTPTLPFIAWGISLVVALAVAALIVETKTARQHEQPSYRGHIGEAFRALLRHHIILVALAIYVLANIYAEAIWTAYQVLYEADGVPTVLIGALFSGIALLSAISAFFVRHVYAKYNPISILFVGSLLMATTAVLLYQPAVWLRIAAVIPMAIASGFMALTVGAMIQSVVPNRLHSTALSIFSVGVYLTYTGGSFWVSRVIDLQGTDAARQTIFSIALVSIAITTVLAYHNRHSSFRLEEK